MMRLNALGRNDVDLKAGKSPLILLYSLCMEECALSVDHRPVERTHGITTDLHLHDTKGRA